MSTDSKSCAQIEAWAGAVSPIFAQFLKKMMRRRKKPVLLVLDGLPAHNNAVVKNHVFSKAGKFELDFLPGYVPNLDPDWRKSLCSGRHPRLRKLCITRSCTCLLPG